MRIPGGVIAGIVAVCLAAVSLVLAAAGSPAMAAEQDSSRYQLQPGDVVEITVIEDPSLDRRLLVGPDGRISMPLAGSIAAGDRTLDQVQASIRSRLASNFVRPPTVTASLVALAPEDVDEEANLFSVYVLGEVPRPGRYDYESDKPISVLQALALAGGAGIFADRDGIQVRNIDQDGNETIRIFDYAAVEDGLAARLGMTLTDGTVIVVPERGLFD